MEFHMTISPVGGSRIYIGGRLPYKSLVTLADFSSVVWTEIKGWTQSGDLGSEQETISQSLISDNVMIYAKGPISFPIMANAFVPLPEDAGQVAFKAAQRSCNPHAFKVEWSADCGDESVVTISVATPAVVAWTANGQANGTPVTFTTTGALPTGLSAGVMYFVVGTSANSFGVAATIGGAAIATTVAGSGIHTANMQEIGETDLIIGLAMFGTKTGGAANAVRFANFPMQPIASPVTV